MKRQPPSSSVLTSHILVVFLFVLVIVMVVANVVILWPTIQGNTDQQQLPLMVVDTATSDRHTVNAAAAPITKNTIQSDNNNKIIDIFREAGVELDESELHDLPTWDEIVSLVGEAPIVHGLDTCAKFRQTVPPLERNLGAAGMFNTGTNLVTQLLKENCKIPERVEKYGPKASREAHGIRWQVSWGKHTPARFKWDHATDHAKDIDKTSILPVVTIRDPYNWMASMCRNGYTAKWPHHGNVCPHLVELQNTTQSVPVNVSYADDHKSFHNSLAHLWNDWYTRLLDCRLSSVGGAL